MNILLSFLLIVFLLGGLLWLFVSTPPAKLAGMATKAGPIMLIAIGGVLSLVGRAGFGVPLIAIGLALLRRMRGVGRMNTSSAGQKSTVRSAAFEMELDHETGDMDGIILIGQREGERLSDLGERELLALITDIRSDNESLSLLETYLDRRFPAWRENAEADAGRGQGSASGSGTMTKEEAYQVLGLKPGASNAEIQAAWRKLMKSMHPDSGGSEFLAAKINMAKDILID